MDGATRTAVTTPASLLPASDWSAVGYERTTQEYDKVESSVSHTLGDGLDNLLLTGSSAINGTGNTLNNVLTGNGAANTLTGGAGNDIQTGGGGADVFAYAAGHGDDIITDFNAGQGDKIDLTGVTFDHLGATANIAVLSDGRTIVATNGYNWTTGDFI